MRLELTRFCVLHKGKGTFEGMDVLGSFQVAEEDGALAIRRLVDALNVLGEDLVGWSGEVAGVRWWRW